MLCLLYLTASNFAKPISEAEIIRDAILAFDDLIVGSKDIPKSPKSLSMPAKFGKIIFKLWNQKFIYHIF